MIYKDQKKKQNLRQDMKENFQRMKLEGDRLVEQWNKTAVGIKLDRTYAKDPEKARRIARALRNEHAHLKRLKEEGTQIKSVFSTRPEHVLRIIRIGVGQSNRANIGHEWQLTTPDDAFYYVDTKFGSTLRGMTEGGLTYENISGQYASEYNTSPPQYGDGSTTTFTFSLSPIPLVILSVELIVGGRKVANDDGNGNWVGNGIASGTIVYSTGSASVTFSSAPANGAEIIIHTNWDSEVNTNYDQWGSIEINLRRDRFNARPHPLTYQFSKMFELVLSTTGVGDADDMLIKRVGDTHAMRKDTKFFQKARELAATNPITVFDASFVNAGSDNLYNHAQTILQTIEKVNGNLYDDIKRGELNKFICGTQAVAFLKMHKLWESDTSQKRVAGSYLAGTLDGKEVYVAPKYSDSGAGLGLQNNEIIATYKNPDEDGDVNIAIGVLTELYAALDYPELYKKGTLATVEDMRTINSKFFRLIQLENL